MSTRKPPLDAPARRVFLTAQWRYLLMLNYEIAPEALLPLVPRGTELDTFQGRAMISIVGFRFLKTRVLGMMFPRHRHFDEVNLRFYVKRIMPDGQVRRAVCFIREIVARRAVATIARLAYNEPYVTLPMRSSTPRTPDEHPGVVSYSWKTPLGWQQLSARAVGAPAVPGQGSQANFITEHYWGYTNQRDGSVIEYEVSHPPWRVWEVEQPTLSAGIAGFYGGGFETVLNNPRAFSSALLCEGSPVRVYFPLKLTPK